jgi:hypothetical protein
MPALRQHLLNDTRGAFIQLEGDFVRMGGWILQAKQDHYSLMQRMGPHPVPLFYGAKAWREHGRWIVSSVSPGHIHWRRP